MTHEPADTQHPMVGAGGGLRRRKAKDLDMTRTGVRRFRRMLLSALLMGSLFSPIGCDPSGALSGDDVKTQSRAAWPLFW